MITKGLRLNASPRLHENALRNSFAFKNIVDKDPPTNDSKERWLEDDARLFLQIRNSIDGKVLTLINHYEFVKELMKYLEFVYSGKGNISRIFDVCKAFYLTEKQNWNSSWNIKRHEELDTLLPFSPNVKVQQA